MRAHQQHKRVERRSNVLPDRPLPKQARHRHQNLTAAGYSGWTDLLFRPSGNSQTATVMKAGVRKGVEQKGYKIILNIGDQLSDLSESCSERTYNFRTAAASSG